MEREALKLALEALERINPRFAEDVMRQHDAVTAIREALAQPAQEQNFCARCGKRTKDIHTCTPPQEKNNG